MRHWLLTTTTYGTWLPGDPRGSVTSVRERRVSEPITTSRREHDEVGTLWEESLPGLFASAVASLKCEPVFLAKAHADLLLSQFRETAAHRGWQLLAVAIMATHFHIVVRVEGDPGPGRVLGDLKSYGSRKLSSAFGKPESGTWWTAEGSKRKLPDERAVRDGVYYVLHKQPNPLVTWPSNKGEPVT